MAVPVLNIPTQELNKRPKPYLKVKQLQLWLDELPTANTDRSAQHLLEQLKTINRSRYPAQERIRLLDTLRPTTRELLAQLKQPLKNSKLPLDKKQSQAADTIQKILEEMAAGYKSVVSQLILSDSRKEMDEMLLREAIYNSIQYLARRLVESYLVYAPEPYDIWRELHQLYNYALQNDIHSLGVDDPCPDYMLPVAYTIELVYKRILLLSLAAPYHLMQNEAEELYHLMSTWTMGCNIAPANKKNINHQFIFDLAADSPPRYFNKNMGAQPLNGRILDIKLVCSRLDNLLLQFSHHDNLDDIPSRLETQKHDMLSRLAEVLKGSQSRQSNRRSAGNSARIAVGLNAAHYYISQKTAFSPEMDELKIDGQRKIEPSLFANAYKSALEKDRRHSHLDYVTYNWKQHNASKTGAALNCSLDKEEQSIQVGELVAYCNKEKPSHHWQVGLIRWLKFQLESGIDMGIMNLSNTAVPVAIKALDGAGEGTDYFRGLMIPKQVSIHQTRSLIVPATLYDTGSVLAVNMKNRFFRVKLSTPSLSTRSFTQYEFEILS